MPPAAASRHWLLGLFNTPAAGGSYSQQWRYTDAPDADARTVQAAYWAYTWSTAQGKESTIAPEIAEAAKMGDYLRCGTEGGSLLSPSVFFPYWYYNPQAANSRKHEMLNMLLPSRGKPCLPVLCLFSTRLQIFARRRA